MLYKIFDENREFVNLSDINQHMIDAIVAIEDQNFWNNEGLDPMGIFRAGFKTMIGQNG
ncbi:transglycosylase domain-containing protein [bacterium]|nr:transglycosylase domain-containing protein [bacterium]MBR4568057.1 transglycosylase domain-containing protein [bacterium]